MKRKATLTPKGFDRMLRRYAVACAALRFEEVVALGNRLRDAYSLLWNKSK